MPRILLLRVLFYSLPASFLHFPVFNISPYFTIVCFLHFIFTAVLYDIQMSFSITDSQAGLLSTAFTLVYLLMAPVFGYLGDRFNRKYLMSFGIICWSAATLIGSFMPVRRIEILTFWSYTPFFCLFHETKELT